MTKNELVPREDEPRPFSDHFYRRVLEVGGNLQLTKAITGRREDQPLNVAPEIRTPHDHIFSGVHW